MLRRSPKMHFLSADECEKTVARHGWISADNSSLTANTESLSLPSR